MSKITWCLPNCGLLARYVALYWLFTTFCVNRLWLSSGILWNSRTKKQNQLIARTLYPMGMEHIKNHLLFQELILKYHNKQTYSNFQSVSSPPRQLSIEINWCSNPLHSSSTPSPWWSSTNHSARGRDGSHRIRLTWGHWDLSLGCKFSQDTKFDMGE